MHFEHTQAPHHFQLTIETFHYFIETVRNFEAIVLELIILTCISASIHRQLQQSFFIYSVQIQDQITLVLKNAFDSSLQILIRDLLILFLSVDFKFNANFQQS